MEGELAREVVHAAGVHQAQSVSHRLGAQHTLACDGAEAAVGQSGRHDAGALAGHLNGAQLMRRDRKDSLVKHRRATESLKKWQTAAVQVKESCCFLLHFTWK